MFKFKKIIIFLFLSVFILFGAGFLLRKVYVAPILMYHSVSPKVGQNPRLRVSAESFRRQMRFLKEKKYNVVPLAELARLIKSGKRIPTKTVAITFDDGYRDFYEYAYPVLKEFGLPATMFIIIEEVDRPQGDRLKWSQILEMQDSGLVDFGSHTFGPKLLTEISLEEELKKQVFDSKKFLEAKLGKRIEAFSYPEGRFSDKIKQMVIGAGYSVAAATNPGKRFANNDSFALKRLRISSTSDNLFVFWIESSGYYNFIRENRHK